MAKNTRHGGDSYTPDELSDPDLPERIQRAELGQVDRPQGTRGEEESSVGTNSLEYSESESRVKKPETPNPQEPAPVGNPSGQEEETRSTVPLTDGSGQNETTKRYAEMSYGDLQAECKKRGLSAAGSTPVLISRLEDDDEDQQSLSEEDDDDFN